VVTVRDNAHMVQPAAQMRLTMTTDTQGGSAATRSSPGSFACFHCGAPVIPRVDGIALCSAPGHEMATVGQRNAAAVWYLRTGIRYNQRSMMMSDAMTYEERAKAVFEEWKASGMTLPEFVSCKAADANERQERHVMAIRLQAFMEDGQQPLIPGAVPEPKPRKPRRVMMHVEQVDGGECFQCSKCGTATELLGAMTEAARKRGIPCPKCNAKQGDQ